MLKINSFLLLFIFLILSNLGFGQYTGYDLSNIVITPGAVNPVDGIVPREETVLTADSTFDIINWNLSWLGAPQMNNNKYGDRATQIKAVAAKLVELNADVYALQEVVIDTNNGDALSDLLAEMNGLSGTTRYSGVASPYHSMYWQADDPDYPSQCLAYIWNKQTVTINNDSALLLNESSRNDFAYGRLPFLLDANISVNGKIQRYMLVNIHLKALSGYSDERASSMALLKELLRVNFSKNNVVLLGDFNVADNTGAIGEIKNWGFYSDDDGDGICDYVHAAGNKNNGIEHLLISNELYDELAYSPEYFRNQTISGTGGKMSDHYAYLCRLYLHEETGNFNPEQNPLFATGVDFTMTKADYKIIVDYVKNDPVLSALDPSTYDDSEYYFGSSYYYSNFDIRSGKHYQSFATWQDAVRAGISKALLPAKFPNAEASATQYYSVTFKTYNNSYSTETFQFKCIKSAPSPEFEFTYGLDASEYYAPVVCLAPNPVSDQLTVSVSQKNAYLTLLGFDGKVIINERPLFNQEIIDCSALSPGVYCVKIKVDHSTILTRKVIKR